MKFLSVIAASLAAYATAQEGGKSFRGGKKDTATARKWGKKPTEWKKPTGKKPTKGKGSGKGPSKGSWHDFFNRYTSHDCTTKYVPDALLAKYKSEFAALDTNHDGSISPAEFAGTGAKIASTFSSLHHEGGHGSHGSGQHHYGHGMEGSGSGASHGGPRHHGNRQLGADKSKYAGKFDKSKFDKTKGKKKTGGESSWMKYLQAHGFGRKTTKMTAASKASKEAKMAAGVFSRFDRNKSKTISVCEFANAMYRTVETEKRLKLETDNIVVVHG